MKHSAILILLALLYSCRHVPASYRAGIEKAIKERTSEKGRILVSYAIDDFRETPARLVVFASVKDVKGDKYKDTIIINAENSPAVSCLK